VQAYSGDGKKPVAVGKLTLVDNTIEQATGTIRLKARFDNEDESLWPGEFVRVRVILTTRPGVATVPSQTVQEGPNGHYAYIIRPDDTVERRPVEVASIQDGMAVIIKGLSPGERVVVSGQYRLTQGARVKVSGPEMGAAG
jgi:multidrug efflux system membrane fusion protein